MYDQLFYRRLTELKTQKNVSARDMSLSLGQNEGYINGLENKKFFPSFDKFFFMCEYLGISPMEFFCESESKDNVSPNKLKETMQKLNSLDEAQFNHIMAIVEDLIKSGKMNRKVKKGNTAN